MWIHDDDLDGALLGDGCPAELREYAIYAAVLLDRACRIGSKTPLIRQRTMTIDTILADNRLPEPVRSLIGKVPGLLEETIDDFLEKNREPVDIKPLAMGFPYLLLPESERQRLFRGPEAVEAGYRQLRRDFPESHGVITLSRVGFDRDRRQSIVAFGHQLGGRCGSGDYVFLESLEGRWLISRSMRGWIS